MSVTPPTAGGRRRARLRAESGFTMIVVLGVLVVTMLLSAAVFAAVQGDAGLSGANVNGKQAYAAAQAGVQEFLYNLNANSENSQWWENCANDTASGTLAGATYSYQPVLANNSTACSSTNPVGSLIDTTTGTLRIASTGTSGSVTRTIVAGFKTLTPLSFVWYTVHETVDSALGGSGCATFYWQGSPPAQCQIYWVTGDSVKGPLYTQDELLINPGASPVFGQSSTDQIETSASSMCVSSCYGAQFADPPTTGAKLVPLPSSNANLQSDAAADGVVYTGTVTLTVNGQYASGWNCQTSTSCTAITGLNLAQDPIIYADNATGCSTSYNPTSVSYSQITSGTDAGAYYGRCGDVFISGNYTTPLTVAAADDVIVTGNLTTTEDANGNPIGAATLGLVANQYVRVQHTCSGNPNVTIDGAILTLNHSFFVDNFQCGGTPLGTLTVHGAIAQEFRGIVGTVNNSGYLKNYSYDDRLALILPPYLFDLQNTAWTVFRETLCSAAPAAGSANACPATGT